MAAGTGSSPDFFGSIKAVYSLSGWPTHVRSTPKTGGKADIAGLPRSAKMRPRITCDGRAEADRYVRRLPERRPFYAAVVRCRVAAQWAAGSAHRHGRRLLRYTREAPMRLIACVTASLVPILANAAQMAPQTSSDRQAYCVNRSADFYPYTGEPCKSGYQLGSGNCRKTDGRIVAVPREECLAQDGTVELPVEDGIPPGPAPRR